MDENEKAKRILEALKNPPPEVTETYQRKLAEMEKGLGGPPSPETLARRCTWLGLT